MSKRVDCSCKGISSDCPRCDGKGDYVPDKVRAYNERRSRAAYPKQNQKIPIKTTTTKGSSEHDYVEPKFVSNSYKSKRRLIKNNEQILIFELNKYFKLVVSSISKKKKKLYEKKLNELKSEYIKGGYNPIMIKELELKYEKHKPAKKKKKKKKKKSFSDNNLFPKKNGAPIMDRDYKKDTKKLSTEERNKLKAAKKAFKAGLSNEKNK